MYHQHCKETKDTFTIPPPPKPSDHFQCARFVCILQSHVCIIFLLLLHFPLPSPLPPLFFLSISPPFSVLPLYLPSLLPSLPCSSSLSPLPPSLPPLFFLSISPPFSPPSPVLPLYLPSLLPSLPCSSSLSPLPSPLPPLFFLSISPPSFPPSPVLPLYLPSLPSM